jgi:hypothetical protein
VDTASIPANGVLTYTTQWPAEASGQTGRLRCSDACIGTPGCSYVFSVQK